MDKVENEDRVGRGRKKNETYTRRTNAEINRDKSRKEQDLANRRLNFFGPRTTTTNDRLAPPTPQTYQEQLVPPIQNEESEAVQNTADNPSEINENPLPGVDLRSIPPLFRAPIGKVMCDLRSRMKASAPQSNQFRRYTTGSHQFPWQTEEYQWPNPLMLRRPPTTVDFLLPKFGRLRFFAPDKTCPHLLPTSQMPCKWHGHVPMEDGNPCTCRDLFFNNFVRPFDDADGTRGFLFSSRYYCCRRLDKKDLNQSVTDVTDHEYYFVGHDPEVLKFLSSEVRSILGLVLTKRRSITHALSNRIFEDVAAKCSFESIQNKTSILRKNLLPRIQRDIDSYFNNKTLACSLVKLHKDEHEMALRLELADVVADVPSTEYIEKHFILRALKLLPYYERCLQLISGRILCGDKSYKVIKFVFVLGAEENTAVRAFDSVYTIMNEFNQVVAINFTRAGDYDEVEEILKGINHRYKIHGFETVRLFYTDSCCHEYNMLLRALPSLGELDPARKAHANGQPLPLAQLPIAPIMVKSWTEFVDAVMPIHTFLAGASRITPIGLDIEWDSLTEQSRQESFPETIQLAIDEPQLKRVIVISIRQTFSEVIKRTDMDGQECYPTDNINKWCTEHNLLRWVLTNSNVELVGVGVAGDITRLRNKLPEALVGHAGAHVTRDCAKMAEKNGLLFSKQKRSLSALVEFFCGLTLDKSLARSRWSALHLRDELINYAALDAWMSLVLYKRLVALMGIHRNPSISELHKKPLVRLLASRSNVVVAFAKVDGFAANIPSENTGSTRTSSHHQDDALVTIEVIIDGSAKIPMQGSSGCVTVGSAQSSGRAVVWPRHRMTLSNEGDVEDAQKRCSNIVVNGTMRNNNATGEDHGHTGDQGSEQFGHETVGTTHLTADTNGNDENQAMIPEPHPNRNTVLTNHELNEVLQHTGVFPDDTTLESYPDRQASEENDDVDFVLISQHGNGTMCINEGDARVFERNGVKGDPFHYLKRLFDTWKRNHGFFKEARGLVRDAILIPNPDQIKSLLPSLASQLKAQKGKKWSGDDAKSLAEAQRQMMCPSSKILKDIERLIPSPTILEQRVISVVKFIANVKDNKTGEPLFSKESWKVYHQLLVHIQKGCVSDETDVNYYYFTTNPNGRQVLHCCRGTSQLEGFHRHLRDILKATHSSPLLAVCLLAVFVHRWNHDRATERSLVSERYSGYYEHEVIHDLQISSDLTMAEQFFGDLLNPNDFVSTGETSYTPIIRRALQLIEPSVLQDEDIATTFGNDAISALSRKAQEMETNIDMSGERTTTDIPVTKMTADDCKLFDELLVKYQDGRAEGRHCVTNYEKMCIEHNAIALDESYLPIGTRRRIFAKTVPILKAHHKDLKTRENMRRTERQIVKFFDNATGTTHATTVRRGIPKIRNQMNDSASQLTFTAPLPRPPENQEPMASAVQDPRERTILFVPPPELQTATIIITQHGPSHIQMPPPIRNQASIITKEERKKTVRPRCVRAPQRCYRCGWTRVGPNHKKRVPTNSWEYCMLPQHERYPFWKVPHGYEVDDNPMTRIRTEILKKQWHQIMEEQGMADDSRFPDWNPPRKRVCLEIEE